jgi:hypothetical protein
MLTVNIYYIPGEDASILYKIKLLSKKVLKGIPFKFLRGFSDINYFQLSINCEKHRESDILLAVKGYFKDINSIRNRIGKCEYIPEIIRFGGAYSHALSEEISFNSTFISFSLLFEKKRLGTFAQAVLGSIILNYSTVISLANKPHVASFFKTLALSDHSYGLVNHSDSFSQWRPVLDKVDLKLILKSIDCNSLDVNQYFDEYIIYCKQAAIKLKGLKRNNLIQFPFTLNNKLSFNNPVSRFLAEVVSSNFNRMGIPECDERPINYLIYKSLQ